MKYYFFMDETGDHGLSFIDKNFPLFLLCGCLIREDKLQEVDDRLCDFKVKYFKTKSVILHSRNIRKCEGAFQILFDLKLKESFYNDLNRIINEANYKIIAAAINKEEHIKKYGKGAADPYSLSLSFIIERLIFCLDDIERKAVVDIKTEERGNKEDAMLVSHFNSILDRGTFYISHERLKERIASFRFHNKRANIIGLQIADLSAYPLARHILNPKEPYIPFNILEKKIYCSRKGEHIGWGLKLFP